MDIQVLYADRHLAVVIKPQGLPAQGDRDGNEHLLGILSKQLGGRFWPVQRLDRPCSGLLLVARTREAAAALCEQLRARRIYKSYLALVEFSSGRLQDVSPGAILETEGRLNKLKESQGILVDYVYRDGRKNISKVCEATHSGAKEARLQYHVLKTGRSRALVRVNLLTGRHHQIRVQMSHLGCPVAGDIKYGASSTLREGGIALCSAVLQFAHPFNHKHLVFTYFPEGRAWEPFANYSEWTDVSVEA